MIRNIREDGHTYLHADDLAREILHISDGLAHDPNLTPRESHIASYVAERLALSIVGGNLSDAVITGDDIG